MQTSEPALARGIFQGHPSSPPIFIAVLADHLLHSFLADDAGPGYDLNGFTVRLVMFAEHGVLFGATGVHSNN